jgi:hypothetical protein
MDPSLTRFFERHSSTCFRAKLLSLGSRIRRATVAEGERSSPSWSRVTARPVDGVDRIGPLPADGSHNNETGPQISCISVWAYGTGAVAHAHWSEV